jgi:hypothetical protein
MGVIWAKLSGSGAHGPRREKLVRKWYENVARVRATAKPERGSSTASSNCRRGGQFTLGCFGLSHE